VCELEQWLVLGAVVEVVERDREAVGHELGQDLDELVVDQLVLDQLEHDALGRQRERPEGREEVAVDVQERALLADKALEADVGQRGDEHGRRRLPAVERPAIGPDLAVQELEALDAEVRVEDRLTSQHEARARCHGSDARLRAIGHHTQVVGARRARLERPLRPVALKRGPFGETAHELREAPLRDRVLATANPRNDEHRAVAIEDERLAAAVPAEEKPAGEMVEFRAERVLLDDLLNRDEPCPPFVADRSLAAVVVAEELDIFGRKPHAKGALGFRDDGLGRGPPELHRPRKRKNLFHEAQGYVARAESISTTLAPMSLGVAFGLTAEQTEELLRLPDDDAREEWLHDLEEEVDDAEWFQYDKAWDELHRCLGDGGLVVQDGPPRAHAVFGSQPLIEDADTATFVGFLPAAEVPAVADALRRVDESWLRQRFDDLGRTDYATYGGPLDDELFEYVWTCLESLREFYGHLVDRRASMVFSVEG
jgi:hypothetical protein